MAMLAQRTPMARARYYGDVRDRSDHGDFALTWLRHDAARPLPRHGHEHAYFCLIAQGGYAERFGSTHVRYRSRTVLFHPPGIVHRDEIAPGGASFLIVEIGPSLLRRAELAGRAGTSFQDLHGGELAQAALRLEREHRDPARRSAIVAEGLVLEMLGMVTRPLAAHDRDRPIWLRTLVDRLNDEFACPLTIAQLARDVDVHPARLSRTFRRRMGVGVGEYVQSLRVRWVENRLGEPDIGLAELALAAGFADQSHLTRVFRRVTGRTPGARRREIRTPGTPQDRARTCSASAGGNSQIPRAPSRSKP